MGTNGPVRREETKAGHFGHITARPQLLAERLQVPVLLPDAVSQVCNFGVSRAVVTRMTPARAVGALLFVQALELSEESNSRTR